MENKNLNGLTTQEVDQRISEGKVNTVSTLKTKSYKRIFYDNICTLFNLVNVILFVMMLFVGSYKNMLFIGVVFFNTASGAFSFVTAIDEDRELVLRNVHKEEPAPTVTPMPTKKPKATITPIVAEETEPTPTAAPTEVPTNTGAPLPTAVPTDTEKPETPAVTEKPTPTVKPTPTAVPGATVRPTPTAVPSARKEPSPTRKPAQNEKQGTKEVKADGKKKYQAITAVLPYAA